jgi:hypothetical protein
MPAAPEHADFRARQRAFAAHLRDPDAAPAPADVAPVRMALYAGLYFDNLAALVASTFPVLRSLYEDADWRVLLRDFCRHHPSRTPLFTRLGEEFIAWLDRRATDGAGDPPWLLELAHHEYSELALEFDQTDLASVQHDPAGDVLAGIPVVSPLARVEAWRFPVHRIGPDLRPDSAPPQPTLLLLVRDRSDSVRFLEIDALTALLLERLQANQDQSGQACIDALLASLGREGEPALRESGAAILRHLRERDAVLGTLPQERLSRDR